MTVKNESLSVMRLNSNANYFLSAFNFTRRGSFWNMEVDTLKTAPTCALNHIF